MNVEVVLISADSPESNRRFRERMQIDFPLISDEDHAIADRYEVPISRKHPKALSYRDGFTQPAIFGYRGEEEVFRFIQKPGMLNLWGAARRPTSQQVLDAIRPRLS